LKKPSAPKDEKVSNDLVKQIRKLRWIGMNGEAEFLQTTLRHLQAVDVVLGTRAGNGLNTLRLLARRAQSARRQAGGDVQD
jgi:hypothetical protein